jgi:chromosome segregation ATPase
MTTTEIITIIASLLSVLISSGALVALFSIKSVNKKTEAEAEKIRRETQKLDENGDLANFQAQIDAANKLNGQLASRLDVVTKQVSDYSDREVGKNKKIDDLEISIYALKTDKMNLNIQIRKLNELIGEILYLINKHLEYHKNVLLFGIPVPISEFTKVSDVFTQDMQNIENKYKELTKEV